jgi:hypothetical protein
VSLPFSDLQLQPAVKGVSLLQHDNGDKMKFDPGFHKFIQI